LAASVKKSPGEFELIARLCEKLPQGRRTILGPGDDCAILSPNRAPQLITVDSMVEDVHFRLGWGTPETLGARSLAVNLSDIAAMGGTPTSCVVNLAIRPGLGTAFFDRLYAGLRKAAAAAGVDIVGGNVTRAQRLAITITLLGDVSGGSLRRDNARAGDSIYVTGTIGDAAVGLRILDGKLKARGAARKFLVDRFLSPTARVDAGRKLAQMRPHAAAIDLSDGLWQDLDHILEVSGVGAEIDPAAIPLSPAYRTVIGDDPAVALSGGDDYELLFCMHPSLPETALRRQLGVPVHQIGKIVSGRRVTLVGEKRGRGNISPRLRGWDQLRGRT
jgi:thiamine-monophosphate kinase